MNESVYKSYEELPLFLNAQMVADVLGVSISSAYEMMRNGIGYFKPMTLEEVGLVFGVTRERARQIEQKALKRIRHPSRIKYLKNYL